MVITNNESHHSAVCASNHAKLRITRPLDSGGYACHSRHIRTYHYHYSLSKLQVLSHHIMAKIQACVVPTFLGLFWFSIDATFRQRS